MIKELTCFVNQNKLTKAAVILTILAIFTWYFFLFFSPSVYYGGTILMKDAQDRDVYYNGKKGYHQIQIIVSILEDGGRRVKYNLPLNIIKEYTVYFADYNVFDSEKNGVTIKDQNGVLIFEGYYYRSISSLFYINGNPYIEGSVFDSKVYGNLYEETNAGVHVSNNLIHYNESYEIGLASAVDFASYNRDTIRGDWKRLILALPFIIILIVDFKFPLFMFKLCYSMFVYNAEPSDFYFLQQQVSRVLLSIIATVFLVGAIFPMSSLPPVLTRIININL